MKDRDNVEIKVGDFVKREGLVQYADGWKKKLSKKTWKVSKIEDEKLYYTDENGNYVELPVPKHEGAFLIVPDAVFEPIHGIKAGGVPQNYRVHGDNKSHNWKDGDIVQIYGNVSDDTIKKGTLERVPDDTDHKHVLIVADPIKVFGNTN